MNDVFLQVNELRKDAAYSQKRGLHFIIAAIIIWSLITLIHASHLPVMTKNMYTFSCSAPLVPLAYFISRLLKIDFSGKSNPLTALGIIFSVNQMLYILIAMWAFSAVPDKMLMIYAVITGAHFLPYGWLYRSKAYYIMSAAAAITALIAGITLPGAALSSVMLIMLFILCVGLIIENRKKY